MEKERERKFFTLCDREIKSVYTPADIQGMDYVETAETLGLPLGTVKSRLARARARLAIRLQGNPL